MKIVVSNEKEVAVLQQEFHEKFPFLKIDFFQLPEDHSTVPPKGINTTKPFKAFIKKPNARQVVITPTMTVLELGNKFKDLYNLDARVFRKSGKAWLETSLTDHWTLQEQNDQGQALSS